MVPISCGQCCIRPQGPQQSLQAVKTCSKVLVGPVHNTMSTSVRFKGLVGNLIFFSFFTRWHLELHLVETPNLCRGLIWMSPDTTRARMRDERNISLLQPTHSIFLKLVQNLKRPGNLSRLTGLSTQTFQGLHDLFLNIQCQVWVAFCTQIKQVKLSVLWQQNVQFKGNQILCKEILPKYCGMPDPPYLSKMSFVFARYARNCLIGIVHLFNGLKGLGVSYVDVRQRLLMETPLPWHATI